MPPDTTPRTCGSCTVCCEVTRIRTEDLVVPTGVRCPHCTTGSGCSVYERRPEVCRDFLCGWRRFAEFPEDWRPDRCGFMIVFDADDRPEYEIVVLGEASDLHRPELAELIVAWVRAGADVVLTLFGRPNELRAQTRLNRAPEPDVAELDAEGLYAVLDAALRDMREYHLWEPDRETLMTRLDTAD